MFGLMILIVGISFFILGLKVQSARLNAAFDRIEDLKVRKSYWESTANHFKRLYDDAQPPRGPEGSGSTQETE